MTTKIILLKYCTHNLEQIDAYFHIFRQILTFFLRTCSLMLDWWIMLELALFLSFFCDSIHFVQIWIDSWPCSSTMTIKTKVQKAPKLFQLSFFFKSDLNPIISVIIICTYDRLFLYVCSYLFLWPLSGKDYIVRYLTYLWKQVVDTLAYP